MNFIKNLFIQRVMILIGIITVLSFAGCKKDLQQIPTQEEASSIQAEGQSGINYVPNEVLVKFSKGLSSNARASSALSRIGGAVSERILTKAMQSAGDNEGLYLIRTPLAVLEAVSKMKGIEIEFAEPNYIYNHYATSNDPYYTNGSLWGMYGPSPTTSPSNQFGSQAGAAWAANKIGTSLVYIGIIDEGYMFTHPDLAANAGVNPGETAGDGIDNDANGLIDDVRGWDFVNNNNTVFDGAQDDHGTHVAGTIGAVGGNAIGVAGVCWNVKLLNAKFLGPSGGTLANAVKAVDYFTNLKTRLNNPVNIVATNNSWGGGGFSQALSNAITRANTAGVLFIAAAGNNGTNNDVTIRYPSSYPHANIIAVAAIGSGGLMPTWSNWGLTRVDLGAPGVGIWSTLVSSTGIAAYASYSGTSMAAPHVTGACALYASLYPGSGTPQNKAAQIKAAILNSAVLTPTASLAGKCVTGGRLNVSGF